MPAMGESVTEGTILEWHVAEGEEVAEGDTIVEVSTDKIDAEVPAPASGVMTKILAQPDDTVAVGQVLAELDPNGTGNARLGATAHQPSDESVADGKPRTEPVHRRRYRPGWSPAAARATATSARATPGVSSSQGELGDVRSPAGDSDSAGERRWRLGETVVVSMPEMGESVTEGTVLEWHVAEGDRSPRATP